MKKHVLPIFALSLSTTYIGAAESLKTADPEKLERISNIKEWIEDCEKKNEIAESEVQYQNELQAIYKKRLASARLKGSIELIKLEQVTSESKEMRARAHILNNEEDIVRLKQELEKLEN